METIVYFFRNTLNGNIYYIVSTISLILILICIKLLINHNNKVKIKDEKFKEEHVVLVNNKGEKQVIEALPVTVINTNTILEKEAPKKVTNTVATTKKVVMINPNEVANVASQMNVFGVKSSQQKEINDNNNDINNSTNTSTINSNSDMI